MGALTLVFGGDGVLNLEVETPRSQVLRMKRCSLPEAWDVSGHFQGGVACDDEGDEFGSSLEVEEGI